MKCPNCDKELKENAKFCDGCGSKIEYNEPKEEVASDLQPSTIPEIKENPKKKSNILVFGVIAAVLAAVAVVLVILCMNKSSKGKIESLEKAINKTASTGTESGTVVATISMGDEKNTMDISGTVKYQIINDEIKMQVSVNKSMFFNEMSLYAKVNKEKADLYVQSSIVDMIMGTSSEKEQWLTMSAPMEDADFNIDEIKKELTKESIEFDDSLKNNIKYNGKKDGLDCYTLVIDKKLVEKVLKEANDEEKQLLEQYANLDKPYTLNMYVNKNGELQKITLDMNEYAKEMNMKTMLLTIEYKDADKTVVDIPSEALKSSASLEDYISENYSFDFDDTDYDFEDSDFDFDDTDFDFDF